MKFIRDWIDAEAERVAEQSAADGQDGDKDGTTRITFSPV